MILHSLLAKKKKCSDCENNYLRTHALVLRELQNIATQGVVGSRLSPVTTIAKGRVSRVWRFHYNNLIFSAQLDKGKEGC
jgi:hypothetical protein